MPFPNFVGKHAEDAFFSPADFIAYKRTHGALPDIPEVGGLILTYQPALMALVEANPGVIPVENAFGGRTLLIPPAPADRLPVVICGGFGIGAPITAAILEEWIAFGVRRVISIGTAGALQPGMAIGGVTLVDRAIRDEGVSHHYLAPGRPALPDAGLSAALGRALVRRGSAPRVGPTWTVDAVYRETVAELRHYQANGVLTVEMEAAAVCAVAAVRGVALATAFTISDSLAELVWNPKFASVEVRDGLLTLYRAAVDVLSAPAGAGPGHASTG